MSPKQNKTSCELGNKQRSECALATALDFIGDKWSMLIIRDMAFVGKQEYKDFLASPESIASNVLSSRLKRLADLEIITKHPHPEGGKRVLYCLTDAGLALLPTIIEISLWGDDHLENTFIPEQFKSMMINDREKLISEITERVRSSQILPPINSPKKM